MKLIVVIGGIGSGKSTVSAVFRNLGASFIDLDELGHSILLREEVKADLAAAFGDSILGSDGEVIRSQLAKCAFSSPESTAQLNQLTQPRIIQEALNCLDAFALQGSPAAVVEISPYDGPQGRFGVFTERADATVAVVAPIELRVKRASGKFSEDDIRNRIARQASDEERIAWATHVLVNDSTQDKLQECVAAIWNEVVR